MSSALLQTRGTIALDGRWRGADIITVRRVLGAVWSLGTLAAAAFAFAIAPPGGDGVAVAAYVAWTLLMLAGIAGCYGPRRAGFDVLYAISLAEILVLGLLQDRIGGWDVPMWQFFGIHAVVVTGCFPARFALPFITVAVLSTMTPVVAGGTAGRELDVVLHTIVWLGTCAIGLAAMARVRARRIELARRANVDELTGLGNRRAMADAFPEGPGAGPGVLGLGDVDDFKSVNDDFGHLAGDACLRDLAAALTAAVECHGLAFRWAGDEVAVLLHADDEAELRDAQAAVEAVTSTPLPDGSVARLSFGWAPWDPALGLDPALRAADAELLARKRGSRPPARAAATAAARGHVRLAGR